MYKETNMEYLCFYIPKGVELRPLGMAETNDRGFESWVTVIMFKV